MTRSEPFQGPFEPFVAGENVPIPAPRSRPPSCRTHPLRLRRQSHLTCSRLPRAGEMPVELGEKAIGPGDVVPRDLLDRTVAATSPEVRRVAAHDRPPLRLRHLILANVVVPRQRHPVLGLVIAAVTVGGR